VRDTLTNLTHGEIGIIVNNHLNTAGSNLSTCYLAGLKGRGRREALHNPTTFVGKKGLGLGLVAIDDVYVVHGRVYRDESRAGIVDEMFGLAPNASYTMTWSVYAVRSDDYFDFINVVRDDLGLNGKTVDGGFAFCIPRNGAPSREIVDVLALKYASYTCLGKIADDPGISLEGIEFIDFPREREVLKRTFEKTRKQFPDLKVMFHVAHSLYATNKPAERYPDSRVIGRDGKQVVYRWDYMNRPSFSKERVKQGWRWYIFYPTLDNSFGKAMLKSVDVMMDDMGATGVFSDGLMALFSANFTHDQWDGHTVEIDPETKLIRRKFASLHLLCQDAVTAYCEKIASKGGVVICDSGPGTLSFARKAPVAAYPVESDTATSCRKTHLAPFPMCLGYPKFKSEPQVYRDVQEKLDWGVLYYYYRGDLGRSTILSKIYPFTFEEIHSGCVKGREKLITAHSGAYGWTGDRDLHFAHLSDGRGLLVPHSFLTTVDSSGVRTEIALREDETAVLKKIPVTLQSRRPVNLIAQQYDRNAIRLILRGRGKIRLAVRDGAFPVRRGAAYLVKTDTAETVTVGKGGTLSFPMVMAGQAGVRIEALERP